MIAEQPEAPIGPSPATPPRRGLSIVLGVSLVVLGACWIAFVAHQEERSLSNNALQFGAIAVTAEPPFEGGTSLRVLLVPRSNFDNASVLDELIKNQDLPLPMREALGHQRERIYYMESSTIPSNGALASGRMPEPGKPEMLAGSLASLDSLVIGDQTFAVTGRLVRSAAGFTTGYILPTATSWDSLFDDGPDAAQAWYYPEFANLDDDQTAALEDVNVLYGGATPSEPRFVAQTLAALLLIAAAGAWAQIAILQALARWNIPGLRTFLAETLHQPRLLWGLTALMFGVFFAAMCIGIAYPASVMGAGAIVRSMFREGDLAHIGAAYESGDVLRAAFATWVQNYFVATIIMTLGVSIIVPFFAVAKNALTFFVVGFALVPLWSGSAEGYVYHSITMTIELQAYVFATFAAVLFPIRVFEGLTKGQTARAVGNAFAIVGGAALLVGIQLALAALYEAATLIALHF